ncbi:hypothetical protein FBU59_003405, partial [Linderina macrospora]
KSAKTPLPAKSEKLGNNTLSDTLDDLAIAETTKPKKKKSKGKKRTVMDLYNDDDLGGIVE